MTLIDRLREAKGPDNALDMEIDIALFRPGAEFVSVSPNAAGTKLVFKRHDGSTATFLAWDHTLTKSSREYAIALLLAKDSK